MNCTPFALPTFFAPDGSNGGPPLALLVGAFAGGDATGAATAPVSPELPLPPEPNPQPSFPFCVEAPRPEQIPVGFAQQVLAQSALLRHCPPINCVPAPFPTFLAPAGSKGGTAETRRVTFGRISFHSGRFQWQCLRLRTVKIEVKSMIARTKYD
jgi:hypothetical protein